MIFGNQTYDENKIEKQDYNLKILNYYYEDKKYSKEEIEIFTIANDIKNKINNKYQVLDKKTNTLRNINYNDFCIIMDRGSEFDKYKKNTDVLLKYVVENNIKTILGGGDIVAAASNAGYKDKVYHASTGGGATLEYLEGKKLPGIEVIK